jgi:hypothetical protein
MSHILYISLKLSIECYKSPAMDDTEKSDSQFDKFFLGNKPPPAREGLT